MITQAEEKPCVDPEVVRDLHETYAALQDEPKNTLEYKLQSYIDKQYIFDEELRKECPKDDEEILGDDEENFQDIEIM